MRPLSCADALNTIINPTLETLTAHRITASDAARAMLIAIGLQESNLRHRFQIVAGQYTRGPARGLWQFEAIGGVHGVLNHANTRTAAQHFARLYAGTLNHHAVWATLAYEDTLACIFARLLLWSDPRALPSPAASSEQVAWEYYLRNWRPGKPHPQRWPANWRAALDSIIGGAGV